MMSDKLEKYLDPKKLRRLLREFGSFPAKHRATLWLHLLNPPYNHDQFRRLIFSPVSACQISFSAVTQSADMSEKEKTHLSRVLRWLAVWNPRLLSIPFLVDFLLPFVRVFADHNPVVHFEFSATLIEIFDFVPLRQFCFYLCKKLIICYWGHLWLELHNFPPFDLMIFIENLVRKFAPGALRILQQNSVTVAGYAWVLLEHGFARVLSAPDWAQLWDHLLANNLAFTLAAVVGYVTVTEGQLRSFHSPNFKEFYLSEHPMDMRHFLRKSYEIFDIVSNWPTRLKRPMVTLPRNQEYPPLCSLCTL